MQKENTVEEMDVCFSDMGPSSSTLYTHPSVSSGFDQQAINFNQHPCQQADSSCFEKWSDFKKVLNETQDGSNEMTKEQESMQWINEASAIPQRTHGPISLLTMYPRVSITKQHSVDRANNLMKVIKTVHLTFNPTEEAWHRKKVIEDNPGSPKSGVFVSLSAKSYKARTVNTLLC